MRIRSAQSLVGIYVWTKTDWLRKCHAIFWAVRLGLLWKNFVSLRLLLLS